MSNKPGGGGSDRTGQLVDGVQSCGTWECREKLAQVIPENERPLPAFASLKAAVCDGLIDFSSADTGHRASFRYRKSFAK